MQTHPNAHRVLFALAPFACASLALAPMAFPQEAAVGAQRSSAVPVAPEVQRAVVDLEALARAQQILQERGYVQEAVRLEAISGELAVKARTASVEARAEALLAGDIHDKAVRVGILELATEGYAASGWESNAEALRWFTSIGQSQLEGSTDGAPQILPMPTSMRSRSGSIMERMTEVVLGAGAVHQQRGNPRAAECCLRLGRFYVQRDLGAFRTLGDVAGQDQGEEPIAGDLIAAEPAAPDSTEPPLEPLKGLGYGGGNAGAKQPATPAEAARLELEREIQALRARIEVLQQRLSEQQPPKPVRESRER